MLHKIIFLYFLINFVSNLHVYLLDKLNSWQQYLGLLVDIVFSIFGWFFWLCSLHVDFLKKVFGCTIMYFHWYRLFLPKNSLFIKSKIISNLCNRCQPRISLQCERWFVTLYFALILAECFNSRNLDVTLEIYNVLKVPATIDNVFWNDFCGLAICNQYTCAIIW